MISDPESEKEKRRRAFGKALSEDTEDLELNYGNAGRAIVKVGDLFASLDRDKVIAELERQRPRQVENREGHIEAWNEIVTLTPIPTTYSCHLGMSSGTDGKKYIDVSGLEDGSEDLLAIEFVDWREWISMNVIIGDDLPDSTPEAMLAAILHEMTFCGYSNNQVSGN